MIPIMIIEPTATTTEQIAGQSSSTATTAARPPRISLHMREAPARHTHSETPFGPQQRQFDFINAKRSPAIANGLPWIKVKEPQARGFCAPLRRFVRAKAALAREVCATLATFLDRLRGPSAGRAPAVFRWRSDDTSRCKVLKKSSPSGGCRGCKWRVGNGRASRARR